MRVHRLDKNLDLIDVAPPVKGFENFIGAYVLHGTKLAIIDVGPASGIKNLFAGLRELDINPVDISYVLATHIHLDHNGGIGQALKLMPNALVIVHEKGKPHLAAPAKLWESSRQTLGEIAVMFGEPEPVPEDRLTSASEGMKIDLDGAEVEALLTPGHASHSLCFWSRREGRLFTGDTAGVYMRDIDLIRPDMPPPFNLEQAIASIDKLASLSPETLCYTHFGCTNDAVEKLLLIKERLLLWGRVIASHLDEEHDWQGIWKDIKEKDTAFKCFDELPPEQRDTQLGFIINSIAGYTGYFKKYGTGVLESKR